MGNNRILGMSIQYMCYFDSSITRGPFYDWQGFFPASFTARNHFKYRKKERESKAFINFLLKMSNINQFESCSRVWFVIFLGKS